MPAKSDDRIRVHKHCKLDAIEDWLEKARSARWRVSKLAVLSGVSVRALNDWFATHRGCTPKQWLEQQQQITAAGLVTWLSTSFLCYRIGLWWIGWKRPCGCMGSLTDALHIKPETADHIAKAFLAYLLISSYGLLIWEWRQARQRRFAVVQDENGEPKDWVAARADGQENSPVNPARQHEHRLVELLLVIAMALLCWSPSINASEQRFSFRGVLKSDVFAPDEGRPIVSTECEFTVNVSNRTWEIELVYNMPSELKGTRESCKRIPDGIRLRHTSAANIDRALLAARALPIAYPPPDKTPMMLCWLCLCPLPELPVLDKGTMRRFISLHETEADQNKGFYSAEYLSPDLQFLSLLTITNDGLVFATDEKAHKYPEPFSSGFVEFRYALTSMTNLGSTPVPLRATLRRYSPKPGGQTLQALYTRVDSSLLVTSVSSLEEPSSEQWPSAYIALDQRPKDLPLDATVNYMVTSDAWRSVKDKSIQRMAQITREAYRLKQPQHSKAFAVLVLGLMVIPVIVYFLVRSIKSTKKQRKE